MSAVPHEERCNIVIFDNDDTALANFQQYLSGNKVPVPKFFSANKCHQKNKFLLIAVKPGSIYVENKGMVTVLHAPEEESAGENFKQLIQGLIEQGFKFKFMDGTANARTTKIRLQCGRTLRAILAERYRLEEAKPPADPEAKPIDVKPLVDRHYSYGNNTTRLVQARRAHTDINTWQDLFPDLNADFFPEKGPHNLQGDALKKEILYISTGLLVGSNSADDFKRCLEKIKNSYAYAILQRSQGIFSSIFHLRTDSVKAFDKIVACIAKEKGFSLEQSPTLNR